MGHRLSKIYTRTGDAGTTGLGDGSRVQKDSLRIEALGAVDELNSVLGVLLAEPLPADILRAAHSRFSTTSSTSAGSCPFRAILASALTTCCTSSRYWTRTTAVWSRSRSSFCPAAAARRRYAISHARSAGGPSAG